jgi:hypothetical protein
MGWRCDEKKRGRRRGGEEEGGFEHLNALGCGFGVVRVS